VGERGLLIPKKLFPEKKGGGTRSTIEKKDVRENQEQMSPARKGGSPLPPIEGKGKHQSAAMPKKERTHSTYLWPKKKGEKDSGPLARSEHAPAAKKKKSHLFFLPAKKKKHACMGGKQFVKR